MTWIYLNLFSKGGLLLDCGEGTLGQLKRRYGVHGADNIVRSLSCIWISHIHADHHTGLTRILALHRDLLKEVPHESLLVVGPFKIKRYFDAYQRLDDLDMMFLDCKHTTAASLDRNVLARSSSPARGSTMTSDENNHIKSAPVVETQAYDILLEGANFLESGVQSQTPP